MNVIGLKFFNDLATDNNNIPTVNHDLRSGQKVLDYAPNEELLNDYSTFSMQAIDTILSKVCYIDIYVLYLYLIIKY